MKKSFDINVTTYQAKTVISIIKPEHIYLLHGEQIQSIQIDTFDDKITLEIGDIYLECSNGWEWNKALKLIDLIHPDPKTMKWHKKKFPGHPCYQDFSK